MKKCVKIFGILIVGVIFFCPTILFAESNNKKTIDDLIAHYKKSGFQFTVNKDKIAAFIGAMSGVSLKIEGKGVEFYKYDTDVPVQKNLIEKYSKDGIDIMGKHLDLIQNGSFVLFSETKHPSWDKILEAFKKF